MSKEFKDMVKPRGRGVFVVYDEFQEKTKGGVFLSEKHGENTRLATIISLGPDCNKNPDTGEYYDPPRLKVGDRVIGNFVAGTILHFVHYDIIDDKYRIVDELECIAVFEEE